MYTYTFASRAYGKSLFPSTGGSGQLQWECGQGETWLARSLGRVLKDSLDEAAVRSVPMLDFIDDLEHQVHTSLYQPDVVVST
jgi:hypothetical protein